MKIEMGKKYKTMDGYQVDILCTDFLGICGESVVIRIRLQGKDAVTTCKDDGSSWSNPHVTQLVEISPWDDFKIDEPVMVRGKHQINWTCRYFAGMRDGCPEVWDHGGTSWTVNHAAKWDQCRRPTAEELNKK